MAEDDIGVNGCSAVAPPPTTATHVPPACFRAYDVPCAAEDDVEDVEECKSALEVTYNGIPVTGVTAVSSDIMPPGCHGKLVDGVVEGMFNTFGGARAAGTCNGNEEQKLTGVLDSSAPLLLLLLLFLLPLMHFLRQFRWLHFQLAAA